eukprot:m.33530 g.33530  ORF g.33530 m.33530 type:complete len:330 (-) comp7201_c0_seq1:118-1107(-)
MSRRDATSRGGNYMEQPEGGWAHNTAALAVGKGVYYSFPVRYIGSIQVIESLRTLDMDQKTQVCWEAISRCCDHAQLRKVTKRKVPKHVKKFLADAPYIKEMDLKINMSVEGIATSSLDENEVISNDVITKISFAAGGEKGEYDFVTYVAKDKRENRYCHVFDCGILSDDVLSTIGQIFNILTKDENTIQTLKKQKEEIATAPPGGAPQLDNPLYHAMANDQGGYLDVRPDDDGGVNAPRADMAAVNESYDDVDGAGGDQLYDTATPEQGQQFAEFLNHNVQSQPLYGEVGDDGQLYGDGAEPGWGYLDVKPDEDLYGGLADVFVEGDQ